MSVLRYSAVTLLLFVIRKASKMTEYPGNNLYQGRYMIVAKSGFGKTIHDSLEEAKRACNREGDQVIKVAADPQENELLYTKQ